MQDSEIRFSVVIPAFNASRTIERAVSSCLQQSYPPAEIIVVDDGSTDGTTPLLLQRFGGQIRLISLSQNKGAAHARNVGMNAAAGTHIAFQDADDEWHPEKLTVVGDALKNSDAGFLYHLYTLKGLNFRIEGAVQTLHILPFWKLLFSNPIGTPCAVVINENSLRFDETMHRMEDYDFFLRAGWKYGIRFLDIPLTQLDRPILSSGGLSGNRWAMRKGEFKAYLNLAKARPVFWLAVPFLIAFGLAKHGAKAFFPPRSNY